MATIKLQVLGKSENAPIYLRLSAGRGVTPRTTTGLYINPKDWSAKTGLPKQTTSANKNLSTDLQSLKIYIFEKFNEASSEGATINTEWLRHNIDVFFKRKNEDNTSEYLTDVIQGILDEVDIPRKVYHHSALKFTSKFLA